LPERQPGVKDGCGPQQTVICGSQDPPLRPNQPIEISSRDRSVEKQVSRNCRMVSTEA
jgi:hypothetical protein